MRILILVHSFPPEVRSASHLFYELAESLVKRGHKVTVITGLPRYNVPKLEKKYKRKILLREEMGGVEVVRLAVPPFPRGVPVARALEQFLQATLFFIGGLFLKKKDIVLVYSPPLPLGLSAYFLKVFKRTPFIFNVQDIYPQTAIDLGLLKSPFLIKLSKAMERFIYEHTSFITVHSRGNLEYLVSGGVDPNKIIVIPNWADTDLIKPEDKMNQFRREHNFGNSFLISFAGVMGFAQDLETIIKSAKFLEGYKDIRFILIGEGPAKKRLQRKAKDFQIKNLKFLPMQTREVYPQILTASDICLVTLRKEVKTPVVPGKIMNIMAAGRPIIGSFPLKGDAAKLIKEAQAGIVIEPGSSQRLSKAILELYQDKRQRETFAKNARKYAEENFAREICVNKYENLFLQTIKK